MRTPWSFVLLLVSSLPLQAQSTADSVQPSRPLARPIASLGLGVGTLGFAGYASIGLQTPIGEIMLRGSGTTDLDFQASVVDSSDDVSLLYGQRVSLGPRAWLRIAAGPGRVKTEVRGQRHVERTEWSYRSWTDREESDAVGLAYQVEVAWRVGRGSVGLGAFGNVNGDRSFSGFALGVHF